MRSPSAPPNAAVATSGDEPLGAADASSGSGMSDQLKSWVQGVRQNLEEVLALLA